MTGAILHSDMCLMSSRRRAGYEREMGIHVTKKKEKKKERESKTGSGLWQH